MISFAYLFCVTALAAAAFGSPNADVTVLLFPTHEATDLMDLVSPVLAQERSSFKSLRIIAFDAEIADAGECVLEKMAFSEGTSVVRCADLAGALAEVQATATKMLTLWTVDDVFTRNRLGEQFVATQERRRERPADKASAMFTVYTVGALGTSAASRNVTMLSTSLQTLLRTRQGQGQQRQDPQEGGPKHTAAAGMQGLLRKLALDLPSVVAPGRIIDLKDLGSAATGKHVVRREREAVPLSQRVSLEAFAAATAPDECHGLPGDMTEHAQDSAVRVARRSADGRFVSSTSRPLRQARLRSLLGSRGVTTIEEDEGGEGGEGGAAGYGNDDADEDDATTTTSGLVCCNSASGANQRIPVSASDSDTRLDRTINSAFGGGGGVQDNFFWNVPLANGGTLSARARQDSIGNPVAGTFTGDTFTIIGNDQDTDRTRNNWSIDWQYTPPNLATSDSNGPTAGDEFDVDLELLFDDDETSQIDFISARFPVSLSANPLVFGGSFFQNPAPPPPPPGQFDFTDDLVPYVVSNSFQYRFAPTSQDQNVEGRLTAHYFFGLNVYANSTETSPIGSACISITQLQNVA